MARVRMVTRSINVNVYKCMCLDTITCEVSVKDFDLTGDKLTNDKALKSLRKEYETDSFKVVAIQSVEIREEMYGMKETDFIKSAMKLDPNTRKALELEDSEND